jgi:Biotin-requiring enzyme
METFNERFSESIAYFKQEAIKAFAGILIDYRFTLSQKSLEEWDNPFQITFVSEEMFLRIEGLGWGSYIDIFFKHKENHRFHSVWHLLDGKLPENPHDGNQIEQLYAAAQWLPRYALDLLHGNPDLIIAYEQKLIEAEQQQRKNDERTEKQRKMDAGYVEIKNHSGERVLQKPPPDLFTLEDAKHQFPDAIAVIVNSNQLLPPSPDGNEPSVVIEKWIKDIHDAIELGDTICELGTDKVVIEYPSPCAGVLIWLLPEGNLVACGSVIALVKLAANPGK